MRHLILGHDRNNRGCRPPGLRRCPRRQSAETTQKWITGLRSPTPQGRRASRRAVVIKYCTWHETQMSTT